MTSKEEKAAEKWVDKYYMEEDHIIEQLKKSFLAGIEWAYKHPKDPDTKLREAVDDLIRAGEKEAK